MAKFSRTENILGISEIGNLFKLNLCLYPECFPLALFQIIKKDYKADMNKSEKS